MKVLLSAAGARRPAVAITIRQDDEREDFDLVDFSSTNPERLHRRHVDQHGESCWFRRFRNPHVSVLVAASAILNEERERAGEALLLVQDQHAPRAQLRLSCRTQSSANAPILPL